MTSMNESSYKPVLYTIATIVVFAVIISTILAVSKANKPAAKRGASPSPEPTVAAEPNKPVTSFNAYIAGVDVSHNAITLCRLGTTDFEEYYYNGATDIRTVYDKPVTASTLSAGEFFTATVDTDGYLSSLTGLKDVDIYRNVRTLTIEPELKRVKIGDELYRYDDTLYLLNEGFFVKPEMLNAADVIDVCSIDGFIYLIKIVSGHGYLTLLNCDEFIGGTLTVDNSKAYQITADMELTVGEGTHTFTVENGNLQGTDTIDIQRDLSAYWSLSQYLPEPQEYGLVAFTVEPYGAALYIDGFVHDYDTPVSLMYGEHNVQVMLTGYTTYTGRIRVSRASTSVNIALSKIYSPGEDDLTDETYDFTDDDSDEDEASYDDFDDEEEDFDDDYDEDEDDFGNNSDDDDAYEGPVG